MKKGMNPEAVDQVAAQLDEFAENVRNNFEVRRGYVTELDWTGEDRDQYISEFEDQVGQATQAVTQFAADLAERARQNAQHQRATSS